MEAILGLLPRVRSWPKADKQMPLEGRADRLALASALLSIVEAKEAGLVAQMAVVVVVRLAAAALAVRDRERARVRAALELLREVVAVTAPFLIPAAVIPGLLRVAVVVEPTTPADSLAAQVVRAEK